MRALRRLYRRTVLLVVVGVWALGWVLAASADGGALLRADAWPVWAVFALVTLWSVARTRRWARQASR